MSKTIAAFLIFYILPFTGPLTSKNNGEKKYTCLGCSEKKIMEEDVPIREFFNLDLRMWMVMMFGTNLSRMTCNKETWVEHCRIPN